MADIKITKADGPAIGQVGENGQLVIKFEGDIDNATLQWPPSHMSEIDKALYKWPISEEQALLLIEFFGQAASYGFEIGDLLQEVMPRIQQSRHAYLALDLMTLLIKYQQDQRHIVLTVKEGRE